METASRFEWPHWRLSQVCSKIALQRLSTMREYSLRSVKGSLLQLDTGSSLGIWFVYDHFFSATASLQRCLQLPDRRAVLLPPMDENQVSGMHNESRLFAMAKLNQRLVTSSPNSPLLSLKDFRECIWRWIAYTPKWIC